MNINNERSLINKTKQEYAEKWSEGITAAFVVLNETAPSDWSYDVEQVVDELMAAGREKPSN